MIIATKRAHRNPDIFKYHDLYDTILKETAVWSAIPGIMENVQDMLAQRGSAWTEATPGEIPWYPVRLQGMTVSCNIIVTAVWYIMYWQLGQKLRAYSYPCVGFTCKSGFWLKSVATGYY
jgi:hypothetical protein